MPNIHINFDTYMPRAYDVQRYFEILGIFDQVLQLLMEIEKILEQQEEISLFEKLKSDAL